MRAVKALVMLAATSVRPNPTVAPDPARRNSRIIEIVEPTFMTSLTRTANVHDDARSTLASGTDGCGAVVAEGVGMSVQRGDQLRHLRVALDAAEGSLGVEHASGGPAQHHVFVARAGDDGVGGPAMEIIDSIGRVAPASPGIHPISDGRHGPGRLRMVGSSVAWWAADLSSAQGRCRNPLVAKNHRIRLRPSRLAHAFVCHGEASIGVIVTRAPTDSCGDDQPRSPHLSRAR